MPPVFACTVGAALAAGAVVGAALVAAAGGEVALPAAVVGAVVAAAVVGAVVAAGAVVGAGALPAARVAATVAAGVAVGALLPPQAARMAPPAAAANPASMPRRVKRYGVCPDGVLVICPSLGGNKWTMGTRKQPGTQRRNVRPLCHDPIGVHDQYDGPFSVRYAHQYTCDVKPMDDCGAENSPLYGATRHRWGRLMMSRGRAEGWEKRQSFDHTADWVSRSMRN